jgi:hypothetical protein
MDYTRENSDAAVFSLNDVEHNFLRVFSDYFDQLLDI